MNTDFFVMSGVIRQWFSRLTKSRVKIIAESHQEWQKIGINGIPYIILLLTRYAVNTGSWEIDHVFLFNSEDRLSPNLRMQKQSANMT